MGQIEQSQKGMSRTKQKKVPFLFPPVQAGKGQKTLQNNKKKLLNFQMLVSIGFCYGMYMIESFQIPNRP